MGYKNVNWEYSKVYYYGKKIIEIINFYKLLIAFYEASSNTCKNFNINKGHIIHAYYSALWELLQIDN